ncbi:hypothetical protein [Porphyrobacter sp. YT40]|uniref:hypothetical protein n=1 Tax=Porphyrobacter sp. YT40 TaxID=2547601 RepID=UPI0011444E4A|nr:hypothetical protein [Porphyrobacter sp. YT40]QDH34095.1 hypothetical protein E2E27_06980 [Porphyrobacter sp. YT40]
MTGKSAHAAAGARLRGGPLVMLALVLAGWATARTVWWDDPFASAAAGTETVTPVTQAAPPETLPPAFFAATQRASALSLPEAPGWLPQRRPVLPAMRLAAGASPVGRPVGGGEPRALIAPARLAVPSALSAPPSASAAAPLLPAPASAPVRPSSPKSWSLDGWAFWRQGSSAAPFSQGRAPVYGASQAGAVLQYRLAPSSPNDPRLYARAYRALVRQGESELALGASARPLARVPLRVAGEVRYTDATFANSWRPAAYAVTELPPLPLPLGTRLEAYGQAGWVGGPQPTLFADGQASLTRELPALARLSGDRLQLSLGAAAWGGAQEDAQRLDLGPTLRLDLRIGEVPARLSVDWREQVAGDAAPRSGVAVTLATGF